MRLAARRPGIHTSPPTACIHAWGAPVGTVPESGNVGLIDDVVRRAQHGDVRAFESIYHTHAPAVYALCRRMVGDEQQARELVQDAFVRAWERLTSFRGHSSLATWLHRLAVNVVLERLRSSRRDTLRLNRRRR